MHKVTLCYLSSTKINRDVAIVEYLCIVLEKCDERNDAWINDVKLRIQNVGDLLLLKLSVIVDVASSLLSVGSLEVMIAKGRHGGQWILRRF